ncbi:hypothetical protein UY3_04805 [Chelonia mydas]|uniref:Uncharacterized protein n=1 Tax=Chelonia mydas TaxID=8469 RepID=M7BJD7_CHEMY|nr:hypothetical protein UY3_04805 [Chelonia mydas]
MLKSDPHSSFLQCLGETHQKDRCKICCEFCPRTLKEREQQLKVILMEAALCPHSDPGSRDPTLMALSSMLSAPTPSMTSVPRKDSSKDTQHRHGSSWGPSDTRHRSHSPVPQKKKKPDDRSLTKPQEVRPQAGHSSASPSGAVLTPAHGRTLSADAAPCSSAFQGKASYDVKALPFALSIGPERNPGPTFSDVFSRLRHLGIAFRCASAPGTYGPDAFSSSIIVESGTVLSSDFGTSLHDVFTPISHACTVADVDLHAGTYGPGADVGTGPPPDPGGSCEHADAFPFCETDADAGYDAYGPSTVIGTPSNAAPGVT